MLWAKFRDKLSFSGQKKLPKRTHKSLFANYIVYACKPAEVLFQ
jgi:hypothetical protein